MNSISNKNIIINLFWRFAERCGAQGVSFIVSIILARILDPEAYGTIALVTVFIAILNVFVDSGLGTALVQDKDAGDEEFSTVFYFNMLMSILLYFVMYLISPFIADFYNNESLIPIVRVLSITLVVSGLKNVQQAYVSKTLQFKRFFYSTLVGTVGAAFVGVFIAYKGGGVWALVVQQVFNTTVDAIILWFTVKWRPKLMFSVKKLIRLLSYGWRLLASSLIDTVYNNARQMIIGKKYSAADLAYYNQGEKFPVLIVNNINTSIDSVLLPVMSREQDSIEHVKSMTQKAIKTSTYVMAPLMIGLAACADNIVKVILTDKWVECIPFLRIFCLVYMFYPIHTANLNAIKAMGRTDIFLKLEIVKKIVGIMAIIISMRYGVLAMAFSSIFVDLAGQLINSWPNKYLLNYKYADQFRDIFPGIFLATLMGIVVYLVGFISCSTALVLVIQVCTGAVVYVGLSAYIGLDSFRYLYKTIKSMIKE